MNNFLENCKLAVVEPSAAASQTTATSTTVDMLGFDTCTFLALLGDVTTTAVLTLTVHHSDAASSGFVATDLTTTFTAGATDADDKLLALEITYPVKRYLRAALTIGTANAVLGGVIAIQSNPSTGPVTQDATVIASSQSSIAATA